MYTFYLANFINEKVAPGKGGISWKFVGYTHGDPLVGSKAAIIILDWQLVGTEFE